MKALVLLAALLAAPLTAATAAPAQAPPSDWNAGVRAQTLTSAEKMLDGYFFADKVAPMKAALEAKRASLVAIGDPRAFAKAVSDVLYSVAHDKHLHLSYSPRAMRMAASGKPTPEQTAFMHQMDAFMDYGYSSSARLPGNVGYLRVAFFPDLSGSKRMYDDAMALLAHTDALIIDLRDNHGGDPDSVDYLLGYFFKKHTEITGFLWRNGAKVSAERMFTPSVLGGKRYDKPVYVLTSEETFSGGEQFSYDMKTLRRAKLIGATTGGGANPGDFMPVSEHFSMFLPTGTARNPYTGTNWEGRGVSPDIAAKSGDALLTGYKTALEALKYPDGPQARDRDMALSDPLQALQIALPSITAPSSSNEQR